jgi:hypothetical protein
MSTSTKPTETQDSGLTPYDVEKIFRQATLVAYSLEGLWSTISENGAPEYLNQELFAIWEMAHSVQCALAKAHYRGCERAAAGGDR